MSSFTDNKTREAQVDFVNYYNAGIQWAAPAGKTVDPDNACGLKVAVQTATTEDTDDLPAKSKACTAAGKKPITMLKIDSQDAVNQAVILGKADAFDADSPITQYAVKQSSGKLPLSGDIYGAAPYGLAVAKNGGTLQAGAAEGDPGDDRRRHLQADPVQVGRRGRRHQAGHRQRRAELSRHDARRRRARQPTAAGAARRRS